MKRNWDIVRSVLLKLEESDVACPTITQDQIAGFDPQHVAYHIGLMREEGLIEGVVHPSSEGDGAIGIAIATAMTWRGHELLDSIRNDGVWADVKKHFKEKGFDMTTDLVIDMAKKLMGVALGL